MNAGAASIEPARPTDLPAILALLTLAGLPTNGVAQALDGGVVARAGGDAVIGCALIERSGTGGLLRSVAVADGRRGGGLGSLLVDRVTSVARHAGITELYLLTETAEGFFARRGWERIDRSAVPAAIRASIEFTTLCPDSSIVMTRAIATTG